MSIKSGPPDKRPDCEPRPKKIILSKTEKKRFQQWVYENVDASDVPQDELNDNALIYNLIHLIEGDGDQYNYREDQDKEILSYAFTFYQKD